MAIRFSFLLLLIICASQICTAQQKDSTGLRVTAIDSMVVKKVVTDSAGKKKHSPRKATLRSAMLPGWGQIYNRKYWKLPIVYGALGVTGYIFNYNRLQYNKVKYAYFSVINRSTPDSALFPKAGVAPELKRFVDNNDSYSLQLYRNEFRKDIDYSVLFFLFFWALNVVDATVDGHLKDFDVSNDLSMHIKPSINALPNTIGMSMVFTIGKHPPKRRVNLP
jgi:hypothetical protein